MLYSVVVLAAMFILFAGLGKLANTVNTPGWLVLSVAFAIVFGGTVGVLWAMRGGKCKCPNCTERTARFTYERDVEFLTCENCELHEKTGYSLGD